MKIYTKTGDLGETGLRGGARVSKASPRVAALGDVDELNATIGMARAIPADCGLEPLLEQIQNWLFDLGAELASPAEGRLQYEGIRPSQIEALERSIDEQTAILPELRNFILPGGSPLAAQLHVCRAVCRRAERSVLELNAQEPQRSEIRAFLNRLSDWLFVSARTANSSSGVTDLDWKRSED